MYLKQIGCLLCIAETFYWFGDNNYTEWADVFAVYNPPPFSLPGLTGAYSFGLAGRAKVL